MSTEKYFETMERFLFEVSRRQYRRALVEQRTGLRLTPEALTQMRSEHPGQPSVPFMEGPGAAVAALFDDQECFALMDAISQLAIVTHKPDVTRYRQDAAVIAHVRSRLASTDYVRLSELKAGLAASDVSRISRLLEWMQKNGELWVDKSQRDRVISLGRPAREQTEIETFRVRLEATAAPVIDLSRFHRHVESDLQDPESPEPKIALVETPTSPSDRLSGSADTWTSSRGSWLVGTAREQADGTRAAAVVRRNSADEPMPGIVLPFKTLRIRDGGQRSWFTTVDVDLVVRVLDFDGSVLWQTSLLESPEVIDSLEAHPDTQPSALLRDLDVDMDHSEIAFAFGGRIYWFALDGTPILGRRLPATPYDDDDDEKLDLGAALVSRGLPADASRRQIAAYLDAHDLLRHGGGFSISIHISSDDEEVDHDEVSTEQLVDDGGLGELDAIISSVPNFSYEWCYFAQLAGGHLYVCGYTSGLLLKLNREGEVVASWELPWTPDKIWEWNGRLFLDEDGELVDGQAIARATVGADADADAPIQIGWSGRTARVVNVVTGQCRAFEAARPIRGVWPTRRGIEVETTTTRANVVLPERGAHTSGS